MLQQAVSSRTKGSTSSIMGSRTAGGRREAAASAQAGKTPPGAPRPGGTQGEPLRAPHSPPLCPPGLRPIPPHSLSMIFLIFPSLPVMFCSEPQEQSCLSQRELPVTKGSR